MPQYQGVWTLEQQAQAQSNQQWVTDPNFKNTTLLLQADGTGSGSQNNTFLDGSTNNFFITRNGNTTQGSFSPFSQAPGYWSNYFDGSTAYLTTPTSAALAYGSGDFTFELFSYTTSNASANSRLLGNWGGSWSANFWSLHSNHSSYVNKYSFFVYNYSVGSAMLVSTSTVPLNQWVHIAITRNGNTWRMFINGVLDVSQTSSVSIDGGSTDDMFIGGTGQAGEYSNGYISNARIVKGTALYTANFTPQTSPLTAVTNTSLLTCQSNRFVDNSANAFAITTNGSPSVQAFGPFAPALQWTPDVVGGSAYFDGTGDYLTLPVSQTPLLLSNSDWTAEAWVYLTATAARATVLSGQSDQASAAGSSYFFAVGTSGTIDVYSGSTNYGVNVVNPPLNAWAYVVYARTGGTLSSYLNGTRISTRSDLSTSSINNGSTTYPPGIGADGGGKLLTGYISSLRLIKGSGGVDATQSTITVPTTPTTAIANTSLLTNFTNAGIYDGKMANNLETVGNAQVSTSPVKYGSGSMYFDGASDWLVVPNSPNLQFVGGNFTIELWVYFNERNRQQSILNKNDWGQWGQWFLYLSSGNAVSFGASSANSSADVVNASFGTPNFNAWNHIAVVRAGTSFTGYINGVGASIGTSSLSLYVDPYTLKIGANVNGSGTPETNTQLNGYMDDIRLTKGVARYFTNFTPPQQALPRQ